MNKANFKEQDISEESLNRLLRRVDWRFLLPNHQPKKSICFTEGTLAQAVEFISESTVELSEHISDCDLAVARNPDQETLKSAWLALSPGGSCYIEWNVSPFFNPNTIHRRLEVEGFVDIDLYLPKPSPAISTSRSWIPIESQGAVNFVLTRGLTSRSSSHIMRLLLTLYRHLWLLSPRLFIKLFWFISSFHKEFMICSTAHKPDILSAGLSNKENAAQRSKTVPVDLSSALVNKNDFIQSGAENNWKPEDTFTLLLTLGRHSFNKIIFLVFSGKNTKPRFLVKVSRVQESIEPLSNEAYILRTLSERGVDIEGIPKVLFSKNQSGYFAVGESFVEGVRMNTMISKENYRELALKATDLLICLAHKTQKQAPDSWRNKIMNPIVSNFLMSHDSIIDPACRDIFDEVLKELSIDNTFCEHRDFAPWNIMLMPNGNLGVLDWESSTLSGLPLTDLIHFLTYLCVYLEDVQEASHLVDIYDRMVDENTFAGSVFKECITLYTDSIGIPHSNVRPLRLITWTIHAYSEFIIMDHDTDKSLNSEMLRNGKYYKLWEYEIKKYANYIS